MFRNAWLKTKIFRFSKVICIEIYLRRIELNFVKKLFGKNN